MLKKLYIPFFKIAKNIQTELTLAGKVLTYTDKHNSQFSSAIKCTLVNLICSQISFIVVYAKLFGKP